MLYKEWTRRGESKEYNIKKESTMRPPVPAPRISQESSTNQNSEEPIPPALPARPKREKQFQKQDTESDTTYDPVEALREFARRKNFTESEIDRAVKRSTFPADTNYFLSQLISVRAEDSTDNFSISRSAVESVAAPRHAKLKNIALDGSNIAMTHGNGTFFSCRGIKLAVDWFRQRGHKSIKAFVPTHRKEATPGNRDVDILLALSAQGIVIFTPSRELPNKTRVTCYDDRFILKYASEHKAVVVSNDQYRDLINEDVTYREIVSQRLLPYTFADNSFMPAEDPMGKRGATLDQFLRLDPTDSTSGECPYGRKCTYGLKCKFEHAERERSLLPEELQRKKEQLQEYIQRKRIQENNNFAPNQQQSQSLPAHLGYHNPHTTEFHSHPTNMLAQPMVVSRGMADGAEQFPPHRPTERRVGPQKVVLQRDTTFPNTGKPRRPVPDPSQHSRALNTNYAPQMTGYPHSFPPYPNQPIQQSPAPLPHIPNSHFNERPNGMINGVMGQGHFTTHPHQGTNRRSNLPHREQNTFTKESDPRYSIYFHLRSLFSEQAVREAMNQLPNETDPKKICQLIMQI